MSKIFGVVLSVGATTVTDTPSARISLNGGKKADGTYKEGVVVELVGKPLAGLAVKDKVLIRTALLKNNVYASIKEPDVKKVSLNGVALKVEKSDAKHDAFEVYGNLVADAADGKFDIIENGEGEESVRYSVRAIKVDVGNMKKGQFVRVAGYLNMSIGDTKVFRNVDAFTVEAVAKKEPAEA